jgi:23S rRNA pseudouridine1911/1915/1917 synthase
VADALRWVVAENEAALRLDAFLARRLASLSRREIIGLITSGGVRLNGRPGKKGARVAAGDTVTAPLMTSLTPNATIPVRVVYNDDALIVLDKPAGVPCVALRHGETGTVANFLLAHFPETATAGPRPLESGLVQRLDTDTSGLLLAARSPYAYAALREQFRARTVEKYYLALVEGQVHGKGTVTLSLAPSGPQGRFMRVVPLGEGQKAETIYAPVVSFPGHTLLRLKITTGVRHQIRVHLAALGHPIVGDTRYGSSAGGSRLCLHAETLTCISPATGQRVTCTSPAPREFFERSGGGTCGKTGSLL